MHSFSKRAQQLLVFEADRRVINITLSSFGTELTVSDKLKLFPSFGSLNPSGQLAMAQCTNSEEFHNMLEVMAPYGSVLSRFKGAEPRTLDKVIVLSCCHVLKLTSNCRSSTKKNILCVKVYFSSDQDTQFSWHT